MTTKVTNSLLNLKDPVELPKYTDNTVAPTLDSDERGLAFNLDTNRPMFWNGTNWVDL